MKKYYIRLCLKNTLQNLIDQLSDVTKVENFILCDVSNSRISSMLCISSIRDAPLHQLNIKSNQVLFLYQCYTDVAQLKEMYPSQEKATNKLTARSIKIGDLCEWRDDNLDYRAGRIKDIFNSMRNGGHNAYVIEYYDNDKMKKLTRTFQEEEQRVFPYLTFTKEIDELYHIPVEHMNKDKRIGVPIIINVGSWFTWNDLYDEILLQLKRFKSIQEDTVTAAKSNTTTNIVTSNHLPIAIPFKSLSSFKNKEVPITQNNKFILCMVDSDTLKCSICCSKRTGEFVQCNGCSIPRNSAPIKYIT